MKNLNRFRSFLGDERGSATVEAVLWIPFFLGLLLLVVEVTFVFYGHSQMMRIAQDASRKLSTGWFDTSAEAEAYILEEMRSMRNRTSTAATTAVSIEAGVINTRISVSAGELDIVGTFDVLSAVQVTVAAQHLQEL